MLELRDISCGYDRKVILHAVNAKVEAGELLGIIGPNGSGKTTLLRVITKVIEPAQGEIMLGGDNIRHLNYRKLARKMAVVSQMTDADLQMDVEEFVLLGRIPYRQGFKLFEEARDLEIARDAMALTDVLDLKERIVESLSSGERQLVFIARALAQEPGLLLLDEPTSHLDITHQVKVLDLIRRLNREKGLTVMIVLHDLNLASQYCDRLLLLSKGSLYKDGPPKDVLTYQIIEEVYKTVVVVLENPISNRPYVFLVTEEERGRG